MGYGTTKRSLSSKGLIYMDGVKITTCLGIEVYLLLSNVFYHRR